MNSLIFALLAGGILGIKHAFEPDHIVAVSTIVTQTKNLSKGAVAGIFWGIGHTATLFLVGSTVLIFKLTIPVKLALSVEFGVGVLLVILGALTLLSWFKKKAHYHAHEPHNSEGHFHTHESRDDHLHNHEFKPQFKTLLIGVVHGLAGSAALVLLVLTTIDSVLGGLTYIFIFGIGSIVGMLLVSAVISLPLVFSTKRFNWIDDAVTALAGAGSLVLGVFLIYEIGFVQGLFT